MSPSYKKNIKRFIEDSVCANIDKLINKVRPYDLKLYEITIPIHGQGITGSHCERSLLDWLNSFAYIIFRALHSK